MIPAILMLWAIAQCYGLLLICGMSGFRFELLSGECVGPGSAGYIRRAGWRAPQDSCRFWPRSAGGLNATPRLAANSPALLQRRAGVSTPCQAAPMCARPHGLPLRFVQSCCWFSRGE